MSTVRRVTTAAFGVVLGVGGVFLGGVRADAAGGITVHPGQSIQAAIDKAKAGDTITVDPGTYTEALLIRKDGITLRAAHTGAHDTILVPPATADNLCTQLNGAISGVCVVAKVADQMGNVITPVNDVTVDGLVINDFGAFGVFGFGVDDFTVRRVSANNDGAYGLVAFNSSKVTFTDNRTTRATEAGIYLGDSPHADATIRDNVSWDNQFGIFVRHARSVTVKDNTTTANCVGIMVLDEGQPGGVGNVSIRDNTVEANNKFCPEVTSGPEAHPPFSGTGVLLMGATDSTVRHNEVENNSSNKSPLSGGIVVVSAKPLTMGRGHDPSNDRITGNDATDNAPADIIWDGTGTGNTFRQNECTTSRPGGLCKDT